VSCVTAVGFDRKFMVLGSDLKLSIEWLEGFLETSELLFQRKSFQSSKRA
jgi:hypothetical protein